MSYRTTRKERILNSLEKVQAALSALYDTYTELSSTGIKSYGFNSGEGEQRVTRKDTTKILDEIQVLEARERSLLNDLYNMGLTSLKLRRKRPCLRPGSAM